MRIGIISDTHGLLRPEALTALQGSDHILHLGDVGNIEILATLKAIAPVTAIRGNVDTAGPCAELPAIEVVTLAGCDLYLLHNLADLDLDPAAAGFQAVLSGHTHKPLIDTKRGVLHLNPGSAGPRRFSLPISCARLTITDGTLHAKIIELSA